MNDKQRNAFCLSCSKVIIARRGRGNLTKFCSNTCRQRHHRIINSIGWSKEPNIIDSKEAYPLKYLRDELKCSENEISSLLGIPEDLYRLYETEKTGTPKLVYLAVEGLLLKAREKAKNSDSGRRT